MTSYKRLKRFITSFALLHLLFSAVAWHRGFRDIYPFFCWDLFSSVPNNVVDYGLRLTHIGDQALAEAVYFKPGRDLQYSVTFYDNIQKLGKALEAGQSDQMAAARIKVEKLYLSFPKPLRYEIVNRQFSPLTCWRTGRFAHEKVIGRFQTFE
ncbi:MAG: hypothetical protein ACRENG_12355 [bacterium]